MVDEKAVAILQDQIRFIDARLSEIELILPRLKPNDYQKQELLDEAASISGMRRAADLRLKELTGGGLERSQNAQRTEALRQARANSFRRSCLETAQEFERQGDHRNAKLARLQALDARKVAEWEIH